MEGAKTDDVGAGLGPVWAAMAVRTGARFVAAGVGLGWPSCGSVAVAACIRKKMLALVLSATKDRRLGIGSCASIVLERVRFGSTEDEQGSRHPSPIGAAEKICTGRRLDR